MQTKNINCPNCKLAIEYWTKRNKISCTKCGNEFEVEPCEDELIERIEPSEEIEELANEA